jgi:HK97 family phage portal protein
MRVRDPIRAMFGAIRNQTPVPYTPARVLSSWADGRRDDPEAQMRAMGAIGTLFSIVNKTSTATAAVDWHMHQLAPGKMCDFEDQRGKGCDARGVRHVENHPALSVWNKPNEHYTRQEFVETEQQHIDLTGEGWWVVSRIASRPVELWPVRPDRIRPVKHATKFIAGYIYRGPDGEEVPLDLADVVQIRMPNPLDPWRGMGPVQAMLSSLDGMRYSSEWNTRFFLNDATPGGIIEFPDGIEDEQWKTFLMRWREEHQGVTNAHRIGTIERGKWVNRTFTMRDMQFAELRGVSREELREAFGIHGHVLGLSEDINKANAEAADVSFARGLTVPRLDRFKHALNHDFLPMFGKPMSTGYELVYTNPVPEDREADNAERTSKATAYKTLVDAGVEPDDAAVVVGLPPMRTRERVMAGVGGFDQAA